MMSAHDLLISEHDALRKGIAEIQGAIAQGPQKLQGQFPPFREQLSRHIHKEDSIYYHFLDAGTHIKDRELMHAMRNDHAATVFSLESLAIRLRKMTSPNALSADLMEDWKKRFDLTAKALKEHFEQEEQKLFPVVERLLSPAQKDSLQDELTKAAG